MVEWKRGHEGWWPSGEHYLRYYDLWVRASALKGFVVENIDVYPAKILAGPFETLEAAKAALLLMI